MKKIFILIILFTSIEYSNAQNIIDFFYSIPTEYIDIFHLLKEKILSKTEI